MFVGPNKVQHYLKHELHPNYSLQAIFFLLVDLLLVLQTTL